MSDITKPQLHHRTYTDQQRVVAVAYARANGNNYRAAARHTGIPPTTIQQWCHSTREVYAISERERSYVHPELLHLLDEKIDTLFKAIDPQRISEASLAAVTNALGTLLDKRERLAAATAITPAEMERRQQVVAEIILHYVTEPRQREAIAAALDHLGTDEHQGPSAS